MVNNLHAMQETWVWSLGQEWLPTPVILLGEFHGQKSPVGYNPWGCKELETTEQVTLLEDSRSSKCSQGAQATKKTWWMESIHLMIAFVTVRMLPGASSRTSVSAASKDPAISLNLREKQECKLLFSLLQVPLPQPPPPQAIGPFSCLLTGPVPQRCPSSPGAWPPQTFFLTEQEINFSELLDQEAISGKFHHL